MGPKYRQIYFLMATVVNMLFVFKPGWCILQLPEDCPPLCSCDELTLSVNCSYLKSDVVPFMQNNTRVLFFDGNMLRVVGNDSFSHMNNLRMLSLANNFIDEIQESSLKNQRKLVYVDLSGNQLGEVPIALNDLRTLKELDLRNNQIRTLSKEPWSNLSRLVVLLLDNNNTTYLPLAMTSKLKRLTKLSVNHNDITAIVSGQFLNTTKLLYLDLSYNRITTRSAYLEEYNYQPTYVPTAMTETEYHDDDIAEGLSVESLKGLVNLKELNLAGNMIQRLENGIFSDLCSLEILNMDGNGLIYIQDMVFQEQYNLTILTMSHNALVEIPQRMLEDLRHLEVLFLDHNSIIEIHSLTNVHMFHMQLLRLNHNKIKSIDSRGFERYGHDDGKSIKSIKEIYLQNNKLKYVPEVRNLSQLEYLDLSKNRIKNISPIRAFEGTNLRVLNLQFNQLQRLPMETFIHMSNLETLLVSDNSFVCDCTMNWIINEDYFYEYDWIQYHDDVQALDEQVVCTSPPLVHDMTLYKTRQDSLRLLCTEYADPNRVMLLVSAWGGSVLFALLAFWLYTYFDFKRRFYVRQPSKKYLLLHNADVMDSTHLTGNHTKVRFRSFDSENDCYIYDEETTV